MMRCLARRTARLARHWPAPVALFLFLALALYQLDLPGLHYDEAKEAGLNALQLARGLPVTPFREAGLRVFGTALPWMVQDYIGALNVYLALPFVAALGPTALALRLFTVVTGAATLACVYWLARRWSGTRLAAGVAALLLAVNPSFIFWSRQGVFVTHITALLFVASLLAAWRWWRTGAPAALDALALLWGLGLWAKLLFAWAIGATGFVLLLACARARRRPAWRQLARGAVIFVAALLPLLLFNLQTGGTLASIFGNLGTSYYGVRNAAVADNLLERLRQLLTLLRGDHFWYLGALPVNRLAVYGAAALLALAAVAVVRRRGRGASLLLPLLLLALMVAQSSFTVSDLFITHDAILLPLLPLAAAGCVAQMQRLPRRWSQTGTALALVCALAWGLGDVRSTLDYHRALARTGGHAAQSDAIYGLARFLAQNGTTAPLALDWGFAAQVAYLTGGQVMPIEAFGYERLDAPDDGFAARLSPFLANPQNVYLFHAPDDTVFRGREDALRALAAEMGYRLEVAQTFMERSGRPLFVLLRRTE